MTNGIVNGNTGIESQFGAQSSVSSATIVLVAHSFSSTASLGIKSAYVPPHMRSSQRAASSPAIPNGYAQLLLYFFLLCNATDLLFNFLPERLERIPWRIARTARRL
jgi:hypothetical protein